MKNFVLAVLFLCGLSTQAPAALSNRAMLSAIVGKISQCDYYNVNYGNNRPYNETCVKRLVESTILASHMVADPQMVPFREVVARILSCPVYHLNSGNNQPYEEVCVDNLVKVAQEILNRP